MAWRAWARTACEQLQWSQLSLFVSADSQPALLGLTAAAPPGENRSSGHCSPWARVFEPAAASVTVPAVLAGADGLWRLRPRSRRSGCAFHRANPIASPCPDDALTLGSRLWSCRSPCGRHHDERDGICALTPGWEQERLPRLIAASPHHGEHAA